jgi:membrane protein implicated in regulation of membrane protease activity
MSTVFLYCSVIGGTILVLQFLMLAFGVGGDTEAHGGSHAGHDVGHDQGAFLKLFTLQTLSTFFCFFGLVGLGTEQFGWSPLAVLVVAVGAGITALWFVAKAMRGLSRLQAQGNVDLRNAVGSTGSVYLRIPAAGQGHGRVLLRVQDRTVECRAVSNGAEIPTGIAVRVLECTADERLVVAPDGTPSR